MGSMFLKRFSLEGFSFWQRYVMTIFVFLSFNFAFFSSFCTKKIIFFLVSLHCTCAILEENLFSLNLFYFVIYALGGCCWIDGLWIRPESDARAYGHCISWIGDVLLGTCPPFFASFSLLYD